MVNCVKYVIINIMNTVHNMYGVYEN